LSPRRITSAEKHKFEEERARMVLALCDPDRFEDSVLSESPDIINERLGIGVEVTNCTKQNVLKGSSWAGTISGKSVYELSKVDRDHIAAHRVSVTQFPIGKLIAGFCCWGDNYDVKGAFQRKLIKLNQSHFQKFAENNFFMLCWMMDVDELEPALNFLLNDIDYRELNMGENGFTKFDKVYLFKEQLLIEINLHQKCFIKREITPEQMNVISHSSFQKVFGMTREEFHAQNHINNSANRNLE